MSARRLHLTDLNYNIKTEPRPLGSGKVIQATLQP